MHPQAYIDLRVVPSFKAERPNAMAHDVMSLLVKFTHAIAARQGFKHALAFPLSKIGEKPSPGNIARVFALDRESLESLADELEKQQFIRDYVSIGRVKVLAADYQPAGYIEYRRFRIPNREKASRARLMAIADLLPYLRVNSSLTGHAFSLYVKPIRHNAASCSEVMGHDMSSTFEPDVYGLSVSKRRFALPLTPEDGWPGQSGSDFAGR